MLNHTIWGSSFRGTLVVRMWCVCRWWRRRAVGAPRAAGACPTWCRERPPLLAPPPRAAAPAAPRGTWIWCAALLPRPRPANAPACTARLCGLSDVAGHCSRATAMVGRDIFYSRHSFFRGFGILVSVKFADGTEYIKLLVYLMISIEFVDSFRPSAGCISLFSLVYLS